MKYVIGAENELRVASEEDAYLVEVDETEKWCFRGVIDFAFRVKKGLLEEWKSPFGTHPRVLARVLPEDALPEIEALQNELSAAEANAKELRLRLNHALRSAALRGERAKPPR